MSNSIPQDRDRLGLRRAWNANTYAIDLGASPAIPNNETAVVLNWARHDLGALVATDHFVGAMAWRTGTGESVVQIRLRDTISFATYDAAWQRITTGIPGGDHLFATICDRDNVKLEGWIDGSRVDSVALAQNPDLSAGMCYQINNSTGQLYSDTLWRCAILSLAPGRTLTQAQWSEVLRYMADPDAPMHPLLTAALGTVYCNYWPGRGVSGSTTVYDTGAAANDLLLSAQVQTVRTRARTPWRRPRRTYYGPKAGEGGASQSTDYDMLAGQPVVARFIVHDLSLVTPNVVVGIDNTAGTNYLEISNTAGVMAVRAKCAGGAIQALPLVGDQLQGGDFWIVCDGVVGAVYLNAQRIGTLALTAALDLSGDNHYQVVGIGGVTSRGAIWNPATVPATFEQEIRDCVCNPESDPPSLTRKQHDWPWSSLTLPLVTSSGFANQGAGGHLFACSGQRQNVAKVMLTGMNP